MSLCVANMTMAAPPFWTLAKPRVKSTKDMEPHKGLVTASVEMRLGTQAWMSGVQEGAEEEVHWQWCRRLCASQARVTAGAKATNSRVLKKTRRKQASMVGKKVKEDVGGWDGNYNREVLSEGAATVIALEPKEEYISEGISVRDVRQQQLVYLEDFVPQTLEEFTRENSTILQLLDDKISRANMITVEKQSDFDGVDNEDHKIEDLKACGIAREEQGEVEMQANNDRLDYLEEDLEYHSTSELLDSEEEGETKGGVSIMELYDSSQNLNDEEIGLGRGSCEDKEMVSIWVEGGAQRRNGWSREMDMEERPELTDKEKRGVPAVMRCFDRAKIYVKAGDGGNGVVAFRREKYVPFGGPSGGSGGLGGNVFIEAVTSMTSLLPFRRQVHFRADRGSHGKGSSREGANGSDCVVKVPVGTIVRAADGQDVGGQGEVLLELTKPGQKELLLPGGRGGRGNCAFKTGRNKVPQLAEFGELGAELWVELELKLVADVGIVGVPNAGKSTLLSAISAARPEVANYPFTTLLPNLGVVPIGYDASMVVADLPGLMEGAHEGVGLGHEFLRHTERCSVLVQVVDGTCAQAVEEYEAIRLELQLFNPALAKKPYIVAYNKMDIEEAADRWPSFQETLQAQGVKSFCMSAATQQGTMPVVWAAFDLLQIQKNESVGQGMESFGEALQVGDVVKKIRDAPIEEYTVTCDKHTRTWEVRGAGLDRFTQMTNWEYFESVRRFQHVLIASGVNRSLREQGVREGDLVIVGQMEFQWKDSDDFQNLGDWKRSPRGSKVWPH